MSGVQNRDVVKENISVAIVAPKAYPVFNPCVDGTYGGAEIALSLVARELSRFEHINVQVLVGDYDQADTERIGRITLRRSLDSKGSVLRSGLRLLSVMNDVDADVYIQRTLTVASALLALYCRLRKRRFVYWVAHDHETDGGHALYRRAVTRLPVRILFRLASHVIAQNEYEKGELQGRFPGVRCSVIKKGMELPANAIAADEVYDAVWVGRCDEWKNPEAFIRLADKNPLRRFLMICPPALGKEGRHQEILKEAARCANLEVRGRTKHREVLNLIQKSRVFCITSSQEGDWPHVVLEAAAFRKPILSLHLEYEGLVSDYDGGKCFYGDFARFSGELEKLIENGGRRTEMGEGAYRYVRDVHDVKKQTVQLMKLIHDLA